MDIIRRVFSIETLLTVAVCVFAMALVLTITQTGVEKDVNRVVRDVMVYEREGHRFLIFDVRSPFVDQYGVSVLHDPDCLCQK